MNLKITIMFVICSLIYIFLEQNPDNYLHLISCDVGQGDSTLVIYKSTQIVVDVGPPNQKAVNCLSDNIPFWDKHIELVVITHPQQDHQGGLEDLLKAYEVSTIVTSNLESSTFDTKVLKNIESLAQVQLVEVDTISTIEYGLMSLDILHPTATFLEANSHEVPQRNNTQMRVTNQDVNNFSVVIKIDYFEFEALLTGDIGPEISDEIAEIISRDENDNYEYIKVPHHGSKNGLSEKLLTASRPEIATISSGEKNRFGHPHSEILDLLAKNEVTILRTDELGDIEIVTDGYTYWKE